MTHIANVKFIPTTVFRTPTDVLLREDLSLEEKASILRQWEYDARERETAEDEGMLSQQPDMLDEVLAALRTLDVRLDTERSAPTKQGGYVSPRGSSVESEARRIKFMVERDGLEAACAWVSQTLETYRQAIINLNSHASRPEYRSKFEATIREFEKWLGNQCD